MYRPRAVVVLAAVTRLLTLTAGPAAAVRTNTYRGDILARFQASTADASQGYSLDDCIPGATTTLYDAGLADGLFGPGFEHDDLDTDDDDVADARVEVTGVVNPPGRGSLFVGVGRRADGSFTRTSTDPFGPGAALGGTCAGEAPWPPPPSDRALVAAWYRDFLGRDAGRDAASGYWTGRLSAQRPSDVVWALTHTREYTEREVAATYRTLLGREPDAGARYWVEPVVAGRQTLEWVEKGVLASGEYAARSGGGAGTAAAWYRAVLGRQASSGEAAYWARRTAAVGAPTAVEEVWATPEALRSRVDGHYRALLGRGADAAGLAYWTPLERQSDINVAVLLASTREYRERTR